MNNKELEKIKKKYGEEFAKFCRSSFSMILEHPGLLTKILDENFYANKALYEDIMKDKESFRLFILKKAGIKFEKNPSNGKTPEQLLEEAGYILYPECKTVEDVEQFRKYYRSDETICTYHDVAERLSISRVWFAVKKNVDEINREDFNKPQREDEYGTSVLSIQFLKDNNSLVLIISRYNHNVENPDATFSGNLDNIVPGLTKAFEETYGINLENLTEYRVENDAYLPGGYGRYYTVAPNGKIVQILQQDPLNNVKYCASNVVLTINEDGSEKLIEYDKDKYVVVNGYIFDIKGKRVFRQNVEEPDEFIKGFGEIKKIQIKFDENNNKVIVVTPEGDNVHDVEITLGDSNEIIEYCNPNLIEIDSNFFENLSDKMRVLKLPNLRKIGDSFMCYTYSLERIELDNVKYIGNECLAHNMLLREFYAPNVIEIGDGFLRNNEGMVTLDLPNVEKIGNVFMFANTDLQRINIPKCKVIGDRFLLNNKKLFELDAKNVVKIGKSFLEKNEELSVVDLPNVEEIGSYFMCECSGVPKTLYLPKVREIGDHFCYYGGSICDCIEAIIAPAAIVEDHDSAISTHSRTCPNICRLYYSDSETESAEMSESTTKVLEDSNCEEL